MKKISRFSWLVLWFVLALMSALSTQAQAPAGQAYTIQTGDSLIHLAEKYLGDPYAFQVIIDATNAKAAEDPSFTPISDSDLILIGQKLWIPTISAAPPPPQTPPGLNLEGPTWRLVGYGDRSNPQAVLAGAEITAVFSSQESRLTGSAGCNNYFASFQRGGDNLSVSSIGSTFRACAADMMVQENQYLSALQNSESYQISGNQLEITSLAGTQQLIFTAVTQPPEAPGDFITALRNAQYRLSYNANGVTQLSNGQFEDPANFTIVSLTNWQATGDLNGDGIHDVVVILVSNTGGSGIFFNLAVVLNQAGVPVNLATEFLGDRVQITKLFVENGQIGVDMITHGPNDPQCCPTQATSRRYQLQNGVLVSLDGHVTANQLANAEYKLAYPQDRPAKLTQGEYRAPLVPGSTVELTIRLVQSSNTGDLNGDGRRDGVAVLASDPGGGIFYDLATVVIQDGLPVNLAGAALGDQLQPKSVFIDAAGTIAVDMLSYGPADLPCCPSQAVTKFYRLQGDQLIEVDRGTMAQTGDACQTAQVTTATAQPADRSAYQSFAENSAVAKAEVLNSIVTIEASAANAAEQWREAVLSRLGYCGSGNFGPIQVTIYPGTSQTTVVTWSQIPFDDSVAAEEVRLDLTPRENAQWQIEWAGIRWQCARGDTAQLTRELCP